VGGMAGYFDELEAVLAGARAAHAEMLERVPAGLRASLPVDATGVTRAIEILAAAVGIGAEIRAERDRLNRSNPAVLHGRVFGRVPLGPDTVVAAFAEGARARATLLARLAEAIDGDALRGEVQALLAEHPPPDADAGAAGEPAGESALDAGADRVAALRAAYDAQERAVLLCAGRLDAVRG
jgi:hypothetical protein